MQYVGQYSYRLNSCYLVCLLWTTYTNFHVLSGGSKEISRYEDIELFRKETQASSVMIARAAEWDCSVFRKEGKLPLDTVISAYLRYAVDYDNADGNTKYCVQNMLRDQQETPLGRMFHEAQTNEQIWYVIL